MADPAHRSMTSVDGDIRIGACPQGRPDLMIRTENIDLAFSEPLPQTAYSPACTDELRMDPRIRPVQRYQSGRRHASQRRRNESQRNRSGLPPRQRFRHPAPPDNIYFRNAMVYDRQGSPGKDEHYAVVNGVLQHSNLSPCVSISTSMLITFWVMTSRISGTKCSAGQHTPPENRVQRTVGNLNINIDARPEENTIVCL